MSTEFHFPTDRISPDSEDAFTEEELLEFVDLIRDSSFIDDFSGQSIEERLTTVFGGNPPEWSAFQSKDAICYVNCVGTMIEEGEQLEVILQFELSEDLQSFLFSGMLIDGIEQPEGLILQFEEQFSTVDLFGDDDDDDFDFDPFFGAAAEDADGYDNGSYDDDDDEVIGDWGDDAAERFWFDPDNDDWDDYDDDDDDGCTHDDGCGCGLHHH